MAFIHALAIDALETAPQYINKFKLAFGCKNISIEQVTQAIAEHKKTLLILESRFNQWLLGYKDALSTNEIEAMNSFPKR